MLKKFIRWLVRKLIGEDVASIERREAKQVARRLIEKEEKEAELRALKKMLGETPAAEKEKKEVIEQLIREAEEEIKKILGK